MYIYSFYIVKQDVCESFDPLNDEHMDAIGDDVDTLKHLLVICKHQILAVYYLIQGILNFSFRENFTPNYVYLDHMGDEIEICEPKEGDRILVTGTAVMVGLGAGMLMNGQNVNAVSSWVSSWWG